MDAYKKYVAATNDNDRIKYLEEYVSSIPKHKGTEHERGMLKRRLALLREGVEKRARGAGGAKEINVKKQGAAQIVFAGFPNAGKSSLLSAITNADAKVANYAFTTVEAQSGMLELGDVSLQLVDLPGLIAGAAENKGMGKRFLTVMRNSDIIAFFLAMDDRPLDRIDVLMREFDGAGIRLNQQKPDVKLIKRDRGGVNLMGGHLLTFPKQEAIDTCREFGILNADVRINRHISLEDFVDAIDKSTVWKKAFVILNKIDVVPQDEVKRVIKLIKARHNLPVIPISIKEKKNLEALKQAIWDVSGLMRVFTVTSPDSDPIVMPQGSNVLEFATKIHTAFAEKFKYARVWGKSVKYEGQRVGKDHVLQEKDVVEVDTG